MARIVSNNVFWFQGRPFEPDSPPAPDRRVLAALAAIHRKMAPDLLCLQEIQTEQAFRMAGRALEMNGCYSPGRRMRQYGAASFWKSGQMLADSAGAPSAPQRAWQLVEIPLKTRRLAVANCHLPSSRHLDERTAAGCRIDEVATILAAPRPPDVILGDFNEQPGGSLGRFLTDHGYLDAAVLTGNQHLGTTPGGRRGDQIWVERGLAAAVTGYGVIPEPGMRTDLEGKEHLSDHFPLWVDIADGPMA